MPLKKPSDFFVSEDLSNNSENGELVESFNQYKEQLNTDKLDQFIGKVESLSEQLLTKADKTDVERASLSQMLALEENIKKLKSSYEGMSKIKNDVIREEFDNKLSDIAEAIDSNIQTLNDKFDKSSLKLKKDSAIFNNLTKIIEGKVDKLDRDDEKIFSIEKTTIDLDKKILDVELKSDVIGEEINVVRGEIDTKINDVVENIDDQFKGTAKNIKSVEESTDKLDRKISNTKVELELEIDGKIDNLSKTIGFVSESLEKINRDDDRVDNLNSNINSIEESIDSLQRKISGTKIELELEDDNLRKNIDSISERVDNTVEQIDNTAEQLDTKIEDITQLVENKLKSDSEEIDLLKEDNVRFKKSISDNLVEHKIKTDDNLKEISTSIDIFIEDLKKETDRIDNRVNQFDDKIENVVEKNNNLIEEYASKLRNEITNVKVDVVINEKTIEKIDGFLNENHQELIDLKEEVFSQIKNLPLENLENNISKLESKIDYIRETYSKINTEETVKEIIEEGLLNEPPNVDNGDPISNDNFVTLQQLQEHYRLFINRIQQQLSTLGGGGEVRLEFLDDIDRDTAKVNGKFLQYNSTSKKWQGADAGTDLSETQIFTGGIAEKFQTGTTLAADNTLALSDGNVIRRTSNESGNQTVNFTGVHSKLSNGEVVSFTVIITPNGSGVINVVQIDGQAITIKWSGGSVPSAGSSGKDVYTFSVFKTGTGVSDYEVYGAATNYA